ncbi:inositol-1-monophosphatase SuhB [Mycobacterium xenopi 3993]|nr:inositol-1-monophosphatase SuhB [Mycobacterium xenopi 3993]
MGARSHRRHGELRLRHPCVCGVGCCAGGRRLGGRCGRRRRRRQGVFGGRRARAHVTDEQGTRPLRCTAVEDLSLALLGTGFGYSRRRRAAQAALLARMLPIVRDVRRIGSAALDLCMVAAGRLDAYYEHGLHLWDCAAGR